MPNTTTRIPSHDHAIVMELLAGDEPQIWVNQEKVATKDLESVMEEQGANWFYGGFPIVLLKVDQDLTAGQVAKVRNLLARMDFDVWVIEKLEDETR